MRNIVEAETLPKEKAAIAEGSCEILQGSWKPNCYKVSHKLEKVRRQAGKSLCKYAKKAARFTNTVSCNV